MEYVVKKTLLRILSPWWRHQMETFSALLALCGELTGHRSIPLKASDAESWSELTVCWTNGWANNPDGSDLRRHRAHYGVTATKSGNHVRFTHITARSDDHHGVSNRWPLHWLFNSTSMLAPKNTTMLHITVLCGRWFPSQRANNVESVSVPWRHHVCYHNLVVAAPTV